MKRLLEKVEELDNDILAFIKKGVDHLDYHGFNSLAIRAFELQYANIPLYKKYCQRRGVTPREVSSWEEIPAIPTDVFKTTDLSLLPSLVCRTFLTSGTANMDDRGRILYDERALGLMDATIQTAASSFLFPDNIKALILIIAPSPESAPHMVMAYGMNRLKEYFGLPNSRFFVNEGVFAIEAMVDVMKASEDKGVPAALFGGSFGFVNFFDYCRKQGLRFKLPPGSRCLDAGGFKGRSREVEREEFLESCSDILGIGRSHCVNLLGMTEIASQFYDSNIRNYWAGSNLPTVKINPPWTRTVAVDPDTLEQLPEKKTGLLKHFDLANRGHVCAILTDDLGMMLQGGFHISGRISKGEERGCSLTIDEMTKIIEEG